MRQSANATKTTFAKLDEEDACIALKRACTTWSVGADEVPMVIPKKIIDNLAPHLAGILDVITHDEAQPRCWEMVTNMCAPWTKLVSWRDIKTHRTAALLPAVIRIARDRWLLQFQSEMSLHHMRIVEKAVGAYLRAAQAKWGTA